MKTIVGITENLTDKELLNLDSFVLFYNHILHKLYVDLFIKKLQIKDLFPIYQAKYFLNSRHLKSISVVLQGKVSSILALNKNYIIDTKDKIKKIEKDLSQQSKTFNKYKEKYKKEGKLSFIENNFKKNLSAKIQYNHIRLSKLKAKLIKLENIKETGNVRLCFGSNKLFRQQFNVGINQSPFKSHEQWYKAWVYNRNKEFTFIGSKDESAGNANAQITHIKNNVFNLKLNLYKIDKKINKVSDKYVNLTFKVDYEVDTLKRIIVNNNGKNKELWQALTYKLIKQPSKYHNKDRYVVAISFEKHLVKHTYTDIKKGCIGVDINQDHLAVANLDNKGNLLTIHTFNYDLNGNKNQNNNSISLAVKSLMELSVKLNKLIVIEKLDFSSKKKSLIVGVNKNRNKQLSSFAYSKIIDLIKSRAEDNFVEVKEVNPAYTSIIGSIKYSIRSRISVHHGAAMCIGRKGLFNIYDENLVKEYVEKRISSKNRQIKSLNLPVRNNLNSFVYWKELKEKIIKSKQHGKKCSNKAAKYSTSKKHEFMPAENASIGTLL